MIIPYLARRVFAYSIAGILAGCAGQTSLEPSNPMLTVPGSQEGSTATVSIKQSKANDEDFRYTLVDVGTFGGPQSAVSQGSLGSITQILTNDGTVVGWADTTAPDPFPGFCFDQLVSRTIFVPPDCQLANAFRWQHGTLTALSTLGPYSAGAFAISNSGLISGVAQNGQTDPLDPGFPEFRAVLWRGQHVTNLGTLGGSESLAANVNDRGQVAGSALNTVPDPYSEIGLFLQNFNPNQTQTRAFVWQNHKMTDLGTLGGPDAESALINQRGWITGDSYLNDVPNPDGFPTDYPFIWKPGAGMKDLGTLGGDSINTTASGFNDRGEVVGSMFTKGDQSFHPYLWDGHKLRDLGTFGGPNGDAGSMNEAGEVVGWGGTTRQRCMVEGGPQVAFLWKNGHMRRLGTLPGTENSDGNWINAKTQVVGTSFKCHPPYADTSGYLWENGVMLDLNTLVPPSSALHVFFPIDINDRGEIAGLGTLPNGDVHAVLLIPNRQHPHDATATPRKVTPKEEAVYRAMLPQLHDRFRRHRRL